MPIIAAKPCRAESLTLDVTEMAVAVGSANPYPGEGCCTDLFLGVFFDGTNNSADRDRPQSGHSNVARLFDVYERSRGSEILRPIYVQGVGTQFDEIGDTGRGIHRDAGLACAWGGEARLNWALLQVQNAIHGYFFAKDPLTPPAQDKTLVKQISADLNLYSSDLRAWIKHPVRTALQQKIVAPRHAERRSLLRQRDAALREKLAPLLSTRKPTVKKLRLAVFGFSRGATQARVFVNWLLESCTQGGETGQMIAGIPLQIDFLGLFDTVASVGFAQSFQELVLDGHDAWASPDALQVPPAVRRCVHLVAAHEVRGSFPLDSVAGASGSWKEVVYPGVHSDIGGGYRPGEQGRSPRDSDKLSQIPLADMYREAVMAGVPLAVQTAPVRAQAAMEVSADLRQAFNAYLAAAGAPPVVNTRALINHHYALYLRWRKARLGTMDALPAVQASSPQDRTDLLEADRELAVELALVERQAMLVGTPLAVGLFPPVKAVLDALWRNKVEQWGQVRPIWFDSPPPPADVTHLFEAFVHDSRAWFKPFADNDDDWANAVAADAREAAELRQRVARQMAAEAAAPTRGMAELHHRRERLARASAESLEGRDKVQTSGREPYLLGWGYLRWRTVYAHFGDSLAETTQRRERIRQASAGPRDRTPAELAAARRRAELGEERARWQGQQRDALDARDARVAQERIRRIDGELERLGAR